MQPFLSGASMLSNQTFLDLFASETIVGPEGLAVQRLALLFTDITGSTSLDDRIGDMRAFNLVRLHFGHLRECISRYSSALVKTIGDAVMASFVDPADALRAALEMRAEIARFNAGAGSHFIGLKVGLHTGGLPGRHAQRAAGLLRADGQRRRSCSGAGGDQPDHSHGRRPVGPRCPESARRTRDRGERS